MIHCRVCQSTDTKPALIADNYHGRVRINNTQYNLYFCKNCTSYFLNTKISPSYYHQAYSQNYYPSTSSFINFLNHISFFIKKINIENYLNSPSQIRILDIGCGPGEFLNSLPPKYQKYGLEINPQAVKTARQRNIKIYQSDINTAVLPKNYYDCVTLWHSIEHFPSPQKVINKIYQSIKPGGMIIMTTPNSDSLGFKFGQKNYFHLDSPRHLFIPNPTNLKLMLHKSGFKNPESIGQIFEYPLDLFWSVRFSPWKLIIYPLYPILKLFSRETITTTAFK